MGIITGGNVIAATAAQIPGSKPRMTYVEALPTDPLVAGSTGRTPVNGELAVNVLNGNVYERIGGVWTRSDTL
jgi:hypothetical protein